MAFHEVVLRFDDHDELRLGDEEYAPGSEVRIDGRTYVVACTEPPATANAAKRFVLVPTDETRLLVARTRAALAAAQKDARMHKAPA